jgi:hypothetical protein
VTAASRTALAAVTVALGGCASAGRQGAGSRSAATRATPAREAAPAPSSLPGTVPAGWLTQRSPLGATLAAPRAWAPERGDRDSLTAVEHGPGGALIGYLNLTPRQGGESAADWQRFRLEHLRGDNERAVRVIAYSPRIRLAGGRAACLTDQYTTSTNARFQELACIVEGTRSAVVLGAAPPERWGTQEPVIARAIAAARP